MAEKLTSVAAQFLLEDPREGGICFGVENPDIFFPTDLSPQDKKRAEAEAKRICGRCPVAQACLEYALETQQAYGIWGGYTEKERRKLQRGRELMRRISK